jgi:hypothetical protein
MFRVDGDMLRIIMSSIMRWRSGVVGLVMRFSREKGCRNLDPDGITVDGP